MLNPDPIVQTNANGFAIGIGMNQTEQDKERHGSVKDYHINNALLTKPRKVAILRTEEEEKEKRVTVENCGYMRLRRGMKL